MEEEIVFMDEDSTYELKSGPMQDAFMHREDVGGVNLLCHDLNGENSGFGHVGKGAMRVSERGECSRDVSSSDRFSDVCEENSEMVPIDENSDTFRGVCGENSDMGVSNKSSDKFRGVCREKSEMDSKAKCSDKFRGVCRENSKIGSKERQSDKFRRVCGENSEMHAKNKSSDDLRTSKNERIELGRKFQTAVSSHNWEFAESLIPLADTQRLNDALCIALDSVWFLRTESELHGITGLIRKLISSGANDFTRAALRTSFLASCVSAWRSQTMSLADTVNVMAQRLSERLEECNGDEVLKAEATAKVQRFTEWALKCIGFHSRCQGSKNSVLHSSAVEIQLQLSAFKAFLDFAGDQLTGKDFTEAFDAACFPLTLFSSAIDTRWTSGIASSAMQGLLGMLVEGGADNVNQCFLEASRFGSTELVRILLQIAQRNSLDVDVELALGFASHYRKISTMECLVDEGHAGAFLGPLMRASERGCMTVVKWFVERGCRDMELCLALTAAASSSRLEAAAYLLPRVPPHVVLALSTEIIKAAGERSGGSFEGVAFLLRSDFLGGAEATYGAAERVARAKEEEGVTPELRDFFREGWSEGAFLRGRRCGEEHYVNLERVLKRGASALRVWDLPTPLQVAIAYLPLYKECVEAGGQLLSQWLRGQLVEAVWRLEGAAFGSVDQLCGRSKDELLTILESHLPSFLITGKNS
ncbi:hypothetical protein AMTRI_Chr13g124460 [Amborella trichopoda]|uniref:Ankyrin repeat protein SKIP35 n=1 Tax=Amborella trichopoda TaxID=13333 RepID=W1PQP8_AMBTC|nr:ankyrin repeat protein SKIP35 [Amborella trichopoda]XP_020525601.1 ankyrin repeat protein SKIP35 [Amborella trichopoda]ERN10124.1 hypothetical protein AMTR_s00169p00037240 [Amborella trichopoda]|eukprot:XP_006848543.1 ankyrin repeat protein SKIP35 [Amborella trichopoda]